LVGGGGGEEEAVYGDSGVGGIVGCWEGGCEGGEESNE
jgi:hypothetical protein